MGQNVGGFQFEDNVEYIKIHGLQRSGTNYLAHLIDNNFENTKALVNAGGWKHGCYCAPWTLGREVHVITITKNPYAWLVSLYNYWSNKKHGVGPDLRGVTFEEFLHKKIAFEKSSGAPYLLRAKNPVEHWNNMHYHWLSIVVNVKQSLIIPYEILLASPNEILDAIAQNLRLQRKSELHTCTKVLEPGEESAKIGEKDWENRDYYVAEKYLNDFTPDMLNWVNSELDEEVLACIGYKKVVN
jgi:hypothetical protein